MIGCGIQEARLQFGAIGYLDGNPRDGSGGFRDLNTLIPRQLNICGQVMAWA
jgi:hypothetical protein